MAQYVRVDCDTTALTRSARRDARELLSDSICYAKGYSIIGRRIGRNSLARRSYETIVFGRLVCTTVPLRS